MPGEKPGERFGWKFFAATCPVVGVVMIWVLARFGIAALMSSVLVIFIVSLGIGFLFNLFGESASFMTRHRRLARGLCPHCGYDLRASRDICPECGYPVPVPKSAVEALAHIGHDPQGAEELVNDNEESDPAVMQERPEIEEFDGDGIDQDGREPPSRAAV